MRRALVILAAALLPAAFASRAQAQACDGRTEQRVDEENYLALNDRIVVYVPEIVAAGNGWKPFAVRVLSGTYRKPLLLQRGFLKEGDVQRLLSTRRDVRQSPLQVPGFESRSGARPPTLSGSVTVKDGERPGKVAVRVTRVVSGGRGADHVFITCTMSR